MSRLDHIKTISLLALPLSLVKRIESHTTYFQIFYLLLGAYAFFKYSLFKKKYIQVVILIFVVNAITAYFVSGTIQFKEYIQLGSLFTLVYFIKEKYNELDFIKYAQVVTSLSILISFINFFSVNNPFKFRSFLGVDRIGGIIGEPNFSAFAMALPWIIFYNNKRFKWLFFASIPFIWVQSRAVLVFVFVFILLELINKFKPSILKNVHLVILSLFFLSPFIITATYDLAPNETKHFLVSKITPRFYLAQFYSITGFKNPFGVGLANGRSYYVENGIEFRNKVMQEASLKQVESNEQHSLFIQVLSEFGIFLYAGLAYLILLYGRQAKYKKGMSNFIPLLSILLFINGLNELTLFISFSYCFLDRKEN
ncbi:MAG: hypothetical protein HON90_13365 [Halobacteriovoraceae bacterium]|nr:hypothetical protein [Halobacteriovoraceae bacterium]